MAKRGRRGGRGRKRLSHVLRADSRTTPNRLHEVDCADATSDDLPSSPTPSRPDTPLFTRRSPGYPIFLTTPATPDLQTHLYEDGSYWTTEDGSESPVTMVPINMSDQDAPQVGGLCIFTPSGSPDGSPTEAPFKSNKTGQRFVISPPPRRQLLATVQPLRVDHYEEVPMASRFGIAPVQPIHRYRVVARQRSVSMPPDLGRAQRVLTPEDDGSVTYADVVGDRVQEMGRATGSRTAPMTPTDEIWLRLQAYGDDYAAWSNAATRSRSCSITSDFTVDILLHPDCQVVTTPFGSTGSSRGTTPLEADAAFAILSPSLSLTGTEHSSTASSFEPTTPSTPAHSPPPVSNKHLYWSSADLPLTLVDPAIITLGAPLSLSLVPDVTPRKLNRYSHIGTTPRPSRYPDRGPFPPGRSDVPSWRAAPDLHPLRLPGGGPYKKKRVSSGGGKASSSGSDGGLGRRVA